MVNLAEAEHLLGVFPDRPVLLVDDEPDWLCYLSALLWRLGVSNLRTLNEPASTIDHVRQFAPSVVLLDLEMGLQCGERLLREIRKAFPGLPVIIISSVTDRERSIACMRQGADDFLVKPPLPNLLVSALNRAIAQTCGPVGKIGHVVENGAQLGQSEFSDMLQNLARLPPLKEAGDLLVQEAMRRSGGVVKKAAGLLGLSPQALTNRRRRRRATKR